MSDATQPQNTLPGTASSSERKLLAPVWHTVLLILFLFAFSAVGYFTSRRFIPTGPHAPEPSAYAMIPTYLVTLVFEWALFFFVFRGEKRYSGATLRERIGGRWSSARDVWRDIAISLGVWVAMVAVGAAANLVLHPAGQEVVMKFLPRGIIELVLWVLLSTSAGFCEEYIFRGYLLEQVRRLTGMTWLAIVIQALIFGISHGYQGLALMFAIFLLGLALGITAKSLKSLRPNMIAHGLNDMMGGLGGYILHALHRA